MPRSALLFPLLIVLLMAACVADPAAQDTATAEPLLSPPELGQETPQQPERFLVSPVVVFDMGSTSESAKSHQMWVQLAVRGQIQDKSVGVVWSADGWETTQTALAVFNGKRANGYGLWRVEADLGEVDPKDVSLAAYFEEGRITWWDNNGGENFDLDNPPPTPARPVRLVETAPVVEHGALTIRGRVETFHFLSAQAVTAVFSTDGWRTSSTVKASRAEGETDWVFDVPIGDGALAEAVEIAVAYDVAIDWASARFWSQGTGSTHRVALAPKMSLRHNLELDKPVSGILRVLGSARTALPIKHAAFRWDDGPWQEGFSMRWTTQGEEDGLHTISFEVTLESGHTALLQEEVSVRNALVPTEEWTLEPGAPGAVRKMLDFAVEADGRIVALDGDGRVLRYARFGDAADIELFEALPEGLNASRLFLDPAGRVLVLGWDRSARRPALVRFDSNGIVGDAAVLADDGFRLQRCMGDAVPVNDKLFVLDTCKGRIVMFMNGGENHGEHVVEGADKPVGALVGAVEVGGKLAVAQADGTLTFFDVAGGVLEVDASVLIELPDGQMSFEDMTVGAGGRFVLVSGTDLVVFDIDGRRETAWHSNPWGNDAPPMGSLEFLRPKRIAPFPDGRVLILLRQGPTLGVFERDAL